MKELEKILNDLDIKPPKPEPLRPINPNDVLEDLFDTFGRIFGNYDGRKKHPDEEDDINNPNN